MIITLELTVPTGIVFDAMLTQANAALPEWDTRFESHQCLEPKEQYIFAAMHQQYRYGRILETSTKTDSIAKFHAARSLFGLYRTMLFHDIRSRLHLFTAGQVRIFRGPKLPLVGFDPKGHLRVEENEAYGYLLTPNTFPANFGNGLVSSLPDRAHEPTLDNLMVGMPISTFPAVIITEAGTCYPDPPVR